MMRLAFPTCSAALFLAVCSFAGLQAETISTSISTGPFSTNRPSVGVSITIPNFNSSLGTLTSVTASLGGSYLYTEFGPDTPYFVLFSQYGFFFGTGGPGATASGTYSYSGAGSVSDAQDLAFYSSAAPGTAELDFDVTPRHGATLTTTNFTGTLTYTYTPFAVTTATPEPSSLVLLGTGVLGVGGVVRRRWMALIRR